MRAPRAGYRRHGAGEDRTATSYEGGPKASKRGRPATAWRRNHAIVRDRFTPYAQDWEEELVCEPRYRVMTLAGWPGCASHPTLL